MKVLLFGGTGMVGQGALRECLVDDRVTDVLAVGRSPVDQNHAKLHQLLHKDLLDLTAIESDLAGYDACLFCLGISSFRMSEDDYRRVTYEYALSVARTLTKLNPGSVFEYVSGAGTDSSESGRQMWARVKGKTENDLLALSLDAYMLRPGIIQPQNGIKSKTRLYSAAYTAAKPLLGVLKRVSPNTVITNEELGRAMIAIAAYGAPERVLEMKDLRAVIAR
ncbi:epimerase [Antrihabitans sp. YC2-6]|uniref:epimerase n=1 Tax=Antrihabitans sp. YC2-6 TaxID=2799498 RepID=UPI001F21B2DB|nr:epimerase [Antrihabitans sp. YC2-6]